MTTQPTPRFLDRPLDRLCYDTAIQAGYPVLLARLLAGRVLSAKTQGIDAAVQPHLGMLDHYNGLPDIEKAATRIASAILTGEHIALETDHDVDGVTSHAVLRAALVDHFGHPTDRLTGFIGHRLRDGYGLSATVAERILATEPRPTLVITADNGSADEPRIARLAEQGIDVIVTDHHELPRSGPPASAYACISPKREDCTYPDPAIAGCMVAWLLACAVRNELHGIGHLDDRAPPMAQLLDYVAVGTVADCVSLGSHNNRAIVGSGLARINRQSRPCWRAICPRLPGQALITATDLAFTVGPRINARGRLDEAMAGVAFLLSENDSAARGYAALLEQENDARKAIEKKMKSQAIELAAEQVAAGATAIVIWLPEGHAGVHGIVASRLVETYGQPVVCLSPKFGQHDLVTGSARGIPGFHVEQALQFCADRVPEMFVAFGGHEGAGGLTIARESIESFRDSYDQAAREQLSPDQLGPRIDTDGVLQAHEMTLDTIDAISRLEPFGRGFEQPVFQGRFHVLAVKAIGDGTHLKLTLRPTDQTRGAVNGVWFNAVADAADDLPIEANDHIELAYNLTANEYRGRQVQLLVRGCRTPQ